MIMTFNGIVNSKGDRTNLVVNFVEKKYFYDSRHMFNVGIIVNKLANNTINKIAKDLFNEGFTHISFDEAYRWIALN